MGIFSLFSSKREQPEGAHQFREEDRELSIELRRQKAELKKLEFERERIAREIELARARAELKDFKEQLAEQYEDDDGEESPDSILNTLIASVLLKNQTPSIMPQPSSEISHPSNTPLSTSLTDDELRQLKSKLPSAYVKQAKKMDDNALIPLLKANLSRTDDDTIKRAIAILRE